MSGRGSTRSRKAAAESATADSTTAAPSIDVEALTVADFRKELKNHSVDAKGFEEAVKNLTDAIEAKQKAAATPAPAPAPATTTTTTTTTTPAPATTSTVATPAKTEEPELDVASLTVVQLKAELEKRGLDTKGLKAELAKRLTAALAAPATPAITTTTTTTTTPAPATTTTTTPAPVAAPVTAPVAAPVTTTTTTTTTSPATTPATSTTADPKKRAVEKLREEAAAEAKKPRQSVVDELCPYARSAKVVGDMDCMLNQTNVGKNNNKFYVIQLLDNGGSYGVWTRWGRVGEPGQNAFNGSGSDLNSATKDFEKKFQDKTKNHWNKRDAFVPVDGKYTYLGPVGGKSTTEKPTVVHVSPKKSRPSTLSANIQDMVNLIFDLNMFKHSMEKLEINTEELPLGKIQKSQILKGYDILEELEAAINKKSRADISKWTSAFYTNIPHAFGRRVPPLIDDIGTVNSKRDLLNVLSDIEVAQGMMNEQKAKEEEVTDSSLPPNPLDTQYSTMDCTIEDVLPGTETFNILETYMRETGSKGWRQGKIIHAYTVNRHSEKQRFALHDSITNRKLLWHGTNVAVVAAILKTGLRIMPHSGGRVGKGIYFASEHSKSAGYVGTSPKNVGFMFLVEVALGREHHITCDDSSLKAAPPGFDCIIAKGHTEPDPSKDITIDIEGKKVVVPQGNVIKMPAYQKSTFSQSEYLVYKESQARLRYILMIQF